MRVILSCLFLMFTSILFGQNELSVESSAKESSIYQVALVDYHQDWIQRIFVVIPSEEVRNVELIQDIVCELEDKYPVEGRSNISFFTEKKYANYKSDIFVSTGSEFTDEEMLEYQKWRNDYYLAEFEYENGIYIIFPSAEIAGKKKKFKLSKCIK